MKIDTEKMQQFLNSLSLLLEQSRTHMTLLKDYRLRQYMNTFTFQVEQLQSYIRQSIACYQSLETKNQRLVNELFDEGQWQKRGLTMTHRVHNSIRSDKSIISYLTNGICIGAFAKVEGMRYRYQQGDDLLRTQVQAIVGYAKGKVDAHATFFEHREFKPTLTLLAQGNACLAKGHMNVTLGNEYVNAQGDVDAEVGCVKAEAKAILNEDGIDLKAEVGAAAIHGEIKGRFTFLGVSVTAVGVGEFASVGASVEFSKTKGGFSFGAKGSLIAGLGFKVDVDY